MTSQVNRQLNRCPACRREHHSIYVGGLCEDCQTYSTPHSMFSARSGTMRPSRGSDMSGQQAFNQSRNK